MTTTAEDESAILEQLERDVHETIEKLKSKATEFNTMTTGDKSQFTADLYRASEKQSRAKSEDSERSLKLFIADPSSAEELSAANSPTIATEGCIMDALLIESGGKSSKKKDDAETEVCLNSYQYFKKFKYYFLMFKTRKKPNSPKPCGKIYF
jgi:hypothetical protein